MGRRQFILLEICHKQRGLHSVREHELYAVPRKTVQYDQLLKLCLGLFGDTEQLFLS